MLAMTVVGEAVVLTPLRWQQKEMWVTCARVRHNRKDCRNSSSEYLGKSEAGGANQREGDAAIGGRGAAAAREAVFVPLGLLLSPLGGRFLSRFDSEGGDVDIFNHGDAAESGTKEQHHLKNRAIGI